MIPLRSKRPDERVRPLEVAQMAQQQVAVDAVPFRLAQSYEVTVDQLKVGSEVEWDNVMRDKVASSAAACAARITKELITDTPPAAGATSAYGCFAVQPVS